MWPSLFEKALSKYFKSFEAVGLGACSSNLVMNSRTFFQHEIDERIQEGMLAWPSLFSPVGHVSIPHTRTVPQVISTSCVAAGKPSKVFEFYDDKHAGIKNKKNVTLKKQSNFPEVLWALLQQLNSQGHIMGIQFVKVHCRPSPLRIYGLPKRLPLTGEQQGRWKIRRGVWSRCASCLSRRRSRHAAENRPAEQRA